MIPAVADTSILWRRIDRPGHEYASLAGDESGWLLAGVALFEHEKVACRLDYSIGCDRSWCTTAARVSGWVGKRNIDITIAADRGRSWTLNGIECPEARGCLDIDLNFSPSTNLLPIRRLALAAGQRSEIRAAWLRFPGFTLEPLDQTYTRVGERTYRYESAGGKFVAEIQVNELGLPMSYGNIWVSE
ncbi:MAG TPA: putative glycolipid-binding domain-containing protein [Thermoanaerobaculia bacterium]|nr:putative glycolipid-binding domain-containing protein [Thermoanaerobaculia bacterium]